MKLTRIDLDQLELNARTVSLGQQKLCADKGWVLYYTQEQANFVVASHESYYNNKTVLIPWSNIKSAVVAPASVPEKQPVGTAKNRDTADGRKTRGSVGQAKTVLAERIEARALNEAASKSSE